MENYLVRPEGVLNLKILDVLKEGRKIPEGHFIIFKHLLTINDLTKSPCQWTTVK